MANCGSYNPFFGAKIGVSLSFVRFVAESRRTRCEHQSELDRSLLVIRSFSSSLTKSPIDGSPTARLTSSESHEEQLANFVEHWPSMRDSLEKFFIILLVLTLIRTAALLYEWRSWVGRVQPPSVGQNRFAPRKSLNASNHLARTGTQLELFKFFNYLQTHTVHTIQSTIHPTIHSTIHFPRVQRTSIAILPPLLQQEILDFLLSALSRRAFASLLPSRVRLPARSRPVRSARFALCAPN